MPSTSRGVGINSTMPCSNCSKPIEMLKPKQEAFYQRVRALYQEAGYAVPTPRQASRMVGAPPDAVRAMLQIGVERGEFVKVAPDLYYPIETLQRLAETLRTLQPPLKVATVRDLTGTSRRIAHALLTWFREQEGAG